MTIDWLRSVCQGQIADHCADGSSADLLVLGYEEYGCLLQDTRQIMLGKGTDGATVADMMVTHFLGIPVTIGSRPRQITIRGRRGEEN